MVFISLSIMKCVPYAIFSYFMRKEKMSLDKIFRFCTKCSSILAVKVMTDVQTSVNRLFRDPRILGIITLVYKALTEPFQEVVLLIGPIFAGWR